MTDFLAAAAIAFAAVLLVELPDKTLVATLVLSTRYHRGPVLAGVSAAFAVQCVIAVTAGGLLRLLPQRLLEAIVALLFGLGAVFLAKQPRGVQLELLGVAVQGVGALQTPYSTGEGEPRFHVDRQPDHHVVAGLAWMRIGNTRLVNVQQVHDGESMVGGKKKHPGGR
jgi:hypothetical protein